MKKFVRDSKFRHVYGQASAKDKQFDGINASNSRIDGNMCSINRKFVAVSLESSGGGNFTVIDVNKPGRYERVFRCVGHTSEVIDLNFDPFYPNRLVSGAEDGCFIVWWIHDGGLDADLSDFQCMLRKSQKRAVMSVWHTSASDILFCANVDGIHIFNVKKAECIKSIDTSQYSEQLFNFSLNYDSTAFAVSTKDKKIRTFDVLSGKMLKEFACHDGSKPIRVSWLTKVGDGNFVVTSGATKMSERQISVWSLDNPSSPVSSENLDNASAVLNIYYDQDTNLLAVFSKGEVSIRLYEFDNDGKIYIASSYQSQEPHRAIGFGNKLSCAFMAGEIMHAVRVVSRYLEIISLIVPRRSDQFQEDLFPDTLSEVPAMTAEEFIEGKTAPPNLICLKDFTPADGIIPTLSCVSSNTPESALRKSTVGTQMNRATSYTSTSVGDLQSQINDLKSQIQALTERVDGLTK